MRLRRFMRRLIYGAGPDRPTVEVFQLRQALDEKRRDINYLKFQLTKIRADKYELEQKPRELRDAIAAILNERDDVLRSTARFHVQAAKSGSGWEVVTEHCCFGGCNMGIHTFPTERDALVYARLLSAVGYQEPHNLVCPACHQEFMKSTEFETGETYELALF